MRTARIEVYRSTRRQWESCEPGEIGCDVPNCSIPHQKVVEVNEWRWTMRSSNGRKVSNSGEGYLRLRDLVRGLELSHPGSVVSWRGEWVLEARHVDTLEVGDIPISVPEGVSLNSRRSR